MIGKRYKNQRTSKRRDGQGGGYRGGKGKSNNRSSYDKKRSNDRRSSGDRRQKNHTNSVKNIRA